MKRYRAIDVPPKFRRAVKGRSTRLGESVYFNRFFSAYNLVYLKFFLMWVGCITLDFLIGFRFELLWPVWLLIRHLYESFRVHAFSSSLHYSAFSVFFVCVTATSDLVCYLFIPIQVLIFLASTYVWVQFVYQSSDRGICLPSLFLWALFIVFEYSVRYRFDNATWYLARTSWITAGLFPSTADSVTVGSSSSTTPSSTRLELYRPFAAHCIGFPVVTLGFRVKSFFSNWRMRVRREEVRRQNEFYERVLADAIPTSFENRKHFISSRNHLSVEQQDTLEYDPVGFTASELLNGLDTNGQHKIYANSSSLAAICAPSATSPFTMQQQNYSTSTSSNLLKKQQRLTKQPSNSIKQQNGSTMAKKNGAVGKGWRQDASSAKGPIGTASLQQSVTTNSALLFNEETIFHKVCRTAFRFCCVFVLSTFGQIISSLQPSFQQTLEGLLLQLRGNSTNQDDLISTSGEGSNAAEEDEWEQESNHFHTNYLHGGNPTSGKRKSRRPRGLSSISQASVNMSNDITTGQQINNTSGTPSLRPTGSSSSVYNSITGKVLMEINGEMPNFITSTSNHLDEDGCELVLKLNELKHLQKEKQTLEQSVEKLKIELKCARNGESELRTQLQHAQQQEQNSRNELKQFEREQKQRLEQLENRSRQLSKQNDHFKTNIQALEKRVGELQLKKLEIERELANERLMKQHADQNLSGTSKSNIHESTEQFKQKLANMDRELKSLKREMKAKDEMYTKLQEETRQLRNTIGVENQQMEAFRQKNFLLEQTLSAENRLKQDLFRALNDSKAEIATIKAQLRIKQTKEQTDMMNAFSSGNSLFHNTPSATGSASSTGSSPTQHPIQQFPILSQQKSMTPPPLSVASSTFNLEQLLQATQNMSYSLCPINSNGAVCNENSYANEYGNGGTSSPYAPGDASEMLIVGGHRSNNNIAKNGGSGN